MFPETHQLVEFRYKYVGPDIGFSIGKNKKGDPKTAFNNNLSDLLILRLP